MTFRNSHVVLAAAIVSISAVRSGAATTADFKAAATTASAVTDSPVVTEIIQKTATTETFLAQDAAGAIEVYRDPATGSFTPSVGEAINLTGYSDVFHSLYEAESSTTPAVTLNVTDAGPGTVPAPTVFTTAALQNGSAAGLAEQSMVGTLSNVTFTGANATGTFASGGTYTVTDGTLTATIFVPSTDTAVIGQPIPAGVTSVFGYLGQYDAAVGTNAAAPSANGFELDPIAAPTGVPEPTSIAAVAAVGLALVGRRRR